ncbi:MAG: DUF4406 domain-containing protein [Rhodospirillales bacterium]|nr:DUF4406 domain-containing protein [Rhodospirillales bacterium]
MWILIAGPYTSGAASKAERARNLEALNDAAWQLWRRGHVPVIGANMALPVIRAAGAAHFEEIMMPLSLALAERCDACLRVGGASAGADAEAERIRATGKPVYRSLGEVP